MDNLTKIDKAIVNSIPLPLCTFNQEGKIVDANKLIGDVFIYDGIKGSDIFQLMGFKYDVLVEASKSEEKLVLHRNSRIFNLIIKKIENSDEYCIYFIDVTDKIEAQRRYEDEKPCIAIINIDNFDQLNSDTQEDRHLSLVSEIDKTIRSWGATLEASITRHKEHMYILIFDNKYCRMQEELKFPILDQVKEIEKEADFPITLSIGIGMNGKNIGENDDFADQALDVALGRGGDQVVVKDGDKFSYYGGKTPTLEKRNKGKSRIIGHALHSLMENSSKIFIMGHKHPDMDAFGASLGVYCMAKIVRGSAYIVLDAHTEAIDSLYSEVKKEGNHDIIGSKKALSMVDEDSLVILVDTHRPSMAECPELLFKGCKTVVVDHHRRSEENLESPTLAYMEPYASSTCELVTEMLQYLPDKKDIKKLEAEALLSGILVDTNRFSVKTGVRTFEAAAWLRRLGADPGLVKRFFQIDRNDLLYRSKTIVNSNYENGIATAISNGNGPNTQVINSQVADILLGIKGVKYSFVAGRDFEGNTLVSARSIGEHNVQIIMEKIGGGGHINAAGAKVDISPREVIDNIIEIVMQEDENLLLKDE